MNNLNLAGYGLKGMVHSLEVVDLILISLAITISEMGNVKLELKQIGFMRIVPL